MISGITPIRGGEEEIGQRVIEWPCSHTVRLIPGELGSLDTPSECPVLNRGQEPACCASRGPIVHSGSFSGVVKLLSLAKGVSWVGFILGLVAYNTPGRSLSWKGSVGLTSTAVHPLSHSDLLTSPGNSFSGTLVGLFFWGNFQRNVSGMN